MNDDKALTVGLISIAIFCGLLVASAIHDLLRLLGFV